MLGDKENLQIRRLSPQQPASLQAIHPWHGDVEHHDIGAEIFCLFQGLGSIGGFSNHLPPCMPFQQGFQTLSHDRMIVDHKNANCQSNSVPRGRPTRRFATFYP